MNTNRRNLSFKLALATMLTLTLTTGTIPVNAQTQSRPNILLIVADDLGYSDLGVMAVRLIHPCWINWGWRGTDKKSEKRL